MAGFPHLLAPGRIGAMTVRNREVMSRMETMYGTPITNMRGYWNLDVMEFGKEE